MPEHVTPHDRGADRVVYSTTDDGLPFAYRPDEVITTQLRRALEVLAGLDEAGGPGPEPGGSGLAYQKIDAWPGEEPDILEPDQPVAARGGAGEAASPRWYHPGEEPPHPDRPTADPESDGPFFLIRGVRDPRRAVLELRLHGIVAQLANSANV